MFPPGSDRGKKGRVGCISCNGNDESQVASTSVFRAQRFRNTFSAPDNARNILPLRARPRTPTLPNFGSVGGARDYFSGAQINALTKRNVDLPDGRILRNLLFEIESWIKRCQGIDRTPKCFRPRLGGARRCFAQLCVLGRGCFRQVSPLLAKDAAVISGTVLDSQFFCRELRDRIVRSFG